MALLDIAGFDKFHSSLESLAEELESLLQQTAQESNNNDHDSSFYTNLQRSRSSAVAFDSYLDNSGSANSSAVDLGSLLENLQTLCRPLSSSRLSPLLDETIAAYHDMFIQRGVGPGTPAATGMHVMWPLRSVYKKDKDTFDRYLLDNPNVLQNAPAWFSFVQTYLDLSYRSSSKKLSETNANTTTTTTTTQQTCSSKVSLDEVESGGTVVVAENEFTTLVEEESDQNDGHELLINPAVVDNGMTVQVTTQGCGPSCGRGGY